MTSNYSLKIGNTELKNPFILAPMAGITNLPFRILCKKYGASLTISEMVSSEAIIRNNQNTKDIMKTDKKKEKPYSVQIFGNNKESLLESAKIIEQKINPDFIDFNMGCPAKDITDNGCGSALLKKNNFESAIDILKTLSSEIKTPITAKIRLGWNNSSDALKMAKKISKTGICALTIHGRTKKQGYSGDANWEIIKKIKQEISTIPIIGNGDINNPITAKKYLDEKYCDAIMIGRSAIGNPLIFKIMNDYYFEQKSNSEINSKLKIEQFFEYLKLCKKYKMDNLVNIKNNAQFFTKGIQGSSKIRAKLSSLKSIKEIENELKKLY
jgi:tRNA-dihydrouridine synthase B